MNRKLIIKSGIITLLSVIFSFSSQAQEAAGCFTSGHSFKPCGSGPWTEYKDGVAYDVWCDCSKTPPYVFKLQSSPTSGNSNSSGSEKTSATTTYSEPSTSQADIESQQASDKAQAELERQQNFNRGQIELKSGLKGGTTNAAPALKTGTTSLPLKSSSSSQSFGLKTSDEAVKGKTIKALKELNCAAFWGLNYAEAVLKSRFIVTNNLEDKYTAARKYAENAAMAKDGKTVAGCPEMKISVPDVPPPMEANPQIQVYNYIIQKTNILVPEIIETQEKIEKTKQHLKNIEIEKDNNRKKTEQIVSTLITTKNEEEKSKLIKNYEDNNKAYDELIRMAEEAEKESIQQNIEADKQGKVYDNLDGIYNTLLTNPERASEFTGTEANHE